MLTNDDLKKIKGVVKDTIKPLEQKVDKISKDVEDLTLEAKAIHKIIETQGAELEKRIENLEEEVGISQSS